MKIKIGEREFATRRPADLDTKLIEASGCNAEETSRMLGSDAAPGHVARALLPFLGEADRPSLAELASEIAAAGTAAVAAQVAALLEPVSEPKAGDPKAKSE